MPRKPGTLIGFWHDSPPVDAIRASKASRFVRDSQIVSRSYKTLEGALGAAYRLSRLRNGGPADIWLHSDVYLVRSGSLPVERPAQLVATLEAVVAGEDSPE